MHERPGLVGTGRPRGWGAERGTPTVPSR